MEPHPAVTVRSVLFPDVLPWLRFGRVLGCVLAPQAVAIAVVTAFSLTALQALVFPSHEPRPVIVGSLWGVPVPISDLIRPVADVLQPLLMISTSDGGWWRIVEAVAIFALWTIAGVALARATAVPFCREASPSFRGAVQWSLGRIVSSLTAIVTPLGGAAVLLAIAAVVAIPAAMPGAGVVWLQVAAPVQFVLGVIAGFIVLLLPILWPLMVAAVAVDDSDAFDAFSRSFSLVTSRFWSALGLISLAAVSAIVVTFAFRCVLDAGVAAVLGAAAWTTTDLTTGRMAEAFAWWRGVTYRGLCGSLFWTHATIIYLFLRQLVDAVPLFSLAGFDDARPAFEPYPVVGMAAPQAPDQSLKVTTSETAPDLGGEG